MIRIFFLFNVLFFSTNNLKAQHHDKLRDLQLEQIFKDTIPMSTHIDMIMPLKVKYEDSEDTIITIVSLSAFYDYYNKTQQNNQKSFQEMLSLYIIEDLIYMPSLGEIVDFEKLALGFIPLNNCPCFDKIASHDYGDLVKYLSPDYFKEPISICLIYACFKNYMLISLVSNEVGVFDYMIYEMEGSTKRRIFIND